MHVLYYLQNNIRCETLHHRVTILPRKSIYEKYFYFFATYKSRRSRIYSKAFLFEDIQCLHSGSIHAMGTAEATVQIPWEMEIIISNVLDLHVRRTAD